MAKSGLAKFGRDRQYSLSTVQQQCCSAADKGWRSAPDAIPWVQARTPTVHWGPDSGKAVCGPTSSHKIHGKHGSGADVQSTNRVSSVANVENCV